ncbi:DUF6090 family protein [Eudoraea adriatica]|uniref:DUF6090 family protein n=1 Tax=Eudoraea adriatica TaxID=446681 RepID=UPI0003689E93|nr:DUF6090 family protein [Eudoraea adriatica]
MINFFRKIRKKLADDSQFFKYARYAIGEILLVTVGILLALQVNNWNEKRKTSKLEMETLRNLKQEIKSNEKLIAEFIKQYDVDKKSVIVLYGLFDEDIHTVTQDSLNQLMLNSFLSLNLHLNQSVYNEVISSGRLSIIQNKELSKMLSEWGSTIEQAKSREEWAEQFSREYVFPFTLDYFTWKNVDKLDPIMQSFSTSDSKLAVDNRLILKSLRFENLIANWIYNLEIIKDMYVKVSEKASIIVDTIDRELKTN